jgi:2'-5' RNA ligase
MMVRREGHSMEQSPDFIQTAEAAGLHRLFFALWPPAEVADELTRRARELVGGHGRVIQASNVHLTLAFLGAVETAQQACYEKAADEAVGQEFELTLDQFGYWRRSGILWAGCTEESPALRALVARLNERLAACGFQPETRPYRVHLTIARHVRRYTGASRGGKAAMVLRRERVDPMPPLTWRVSDFTLVESRTLPDGARYQVLHRWPLA